MFVLLNVTEISFNKLQQKNIFQEIVAQNKIIWFEDVILITLTITVTLWKEKQLRKSGN